MRTVEEVLEMRADLETYKAQSIEQAISLKASFDFLTWVLGDDAPKPERSDVRP
jgi:hypothetical protein